MTQTCSEKKRNGQKVWIAVKRQEFCEVKGKDTDKVVVGGGVCACVYEGEEKLSVSPHRSTWSSLNIPYRLGGA